MSLTDIIFSTQKPNIEEKMENPHTLCHVTVKKKNTFCIGFPKNIHSFLSEWVVVILTVGRLKQMCP